MQYNLIILAAVTFWTMLSTTLSIKATISTNEETVFYFL